MHIFVSPHLDDAVLSCGATIAKLTAASDDVRVVTVFTGEPTTLSPLAKAMHRMWGLAGVRDRRNEDVQACSVVGADCEHLGFHEALYRVDPAGKPCYGRLRLLTGPVAAQDDAVLARIASTLTEVFERWPGAGIHGPAAVGDHVDHALTRQAVQLALQRPLRPGDHRLQLYEDLPYGCRATGTAGKPPGREVLSACSARYRDTKIAAVERYATQLDLLWPERDWARELSEHSARIGAGCGDYVERSWLVDHTGVGS
ncbi:PIG-L family deacetylase [Solihabitans fulvus]|uniref:PIG-L family deacetylase n=1 Tax=Solihabitans fulvus TaxID=1892852 RepID=A0A5B2XSA9_9PSEU|nr:PIG-L family deacetylase [Solihabitans fulvus]KAA2265822.1 PIG-L family deacetylase [Solihabitans fulvus]